VEPVVRASPAHPYSDVACEHLADRGNACMEVTPSAAVARGRDAVVGSRACRALRGRVGLTHTSASILVNVVSSPSIVKVDRASGRGRKPRPAGLDHPSGATRVLRMAHSRGNSRGANCLYGGSMPPPSKPRARRFCGNVSWLLSGAARVTGGGIDHLAGKCVQLRRPSPGP
jgi:hypothetical protein